MRRTRWVWVALVMAVLLLAGCGKDSADTRGGGGTGRVFGESTRRVSVYFGDFQAQHLIPEEREIPTNLSMSQLVAEVVKELQKGPTDPTLNRTIPSEVRLLDAKVEGEVATVNFSTEILSVRGATAVNQMLGAVLLSLTDLGGINQVQILVEGQKGAALDEGIVLNEPIVRPFYGDVPYTPNPDRVRYLQKALAEDKRLQWRTEPISVLRFDGRGFGFPAGQLELATIISTDGLAHAHFSYNGTIYVIELVRNPEVEKNGVWSISRVISHRVESGAIELPVYFSDRQAVGVVPERRALSEGIHGLPTAVVEALLAGPTDPFLKPVFPAGTRLLRAVTVSADGVATVDLSSHVRKLSGSVETGRMVDALVYSLTELGRIQKVQILIENKKGEELGNFKFDQPMGRGQISEQYHFDQDRVGWLQSWVENGQDSFRLDPVQMLMWEGRGLGFTPDLLKTAQLDQQADRALATLTYQGKTHVIEMGRNPGEKGIWFIKSIAVQ